MKLRYVALAVLLTVASARAGEKKFVIDPVHSGVGFRIRHLVSMFPGRFDVFSGTIVCDTNNVAGMTVRATVDVSSVSTANAARDKHLRTADFFDVEKFPRATFESTEVKAGADGALTIRGKLVLRGIEAEVVFDGKVLGFGPDMKGVNRVGYQGKGTIDRTKFGIVYNAPLAGGLQMLGSEVELTLDIEAIEVQESPEAASGEQKK